MLHVVESDEVEKGESGDFAHGSSLGAEPFVLDPLHGVAEIFSERFAPSETSGIH